MPELPEVETVRQGFLKHLAPLMARGVEIDVYKPLRRDLRFPFPSAKKVLTQLQGKKLLSIERRAKYLLFVTEGGTLLSHLGMTGSWRQLQPSSELLPHDHLILGFKHQGLWVYNDPRRFGFIQLFNKQSSFLQHLGPEPLGQDFTADYLYAAVQKAKVKKLKVGIKAWLMNQANVVGVGNIYAVEALFQVGIRPQRRLAKLSQQEAEALVACVRAVLRRAIELGGSSISDFKNTEGQLGYFQNQHQVYGREGEDCRKCQQKVRNITIAGRASCYCPNCQS